jgi:hypothetical protein
LFSLDMANHCAPKAVNDGDWYATIGVEPWVDGQRAVVPPERRRQVRRDSTAGRSNYGCQSLKD